MRKYKAGSGGGGAWRRLAAQLRAALADHLATGKPPRVPIAGVPIWQAFALASSERGFSEGGPQPLRLEDMQRHGAALGFPLSARHLEIIRAMDGDWCAAVAKPLGKVPPPLTPEMFDAMVG
jgi:hypothetical protein